MGSEKDIIEVVVAGTLLILFLGGCIIFFVVMYKKRQLRYRNEKLQMEQAFHEELLKTQLEIREQTLRNIGQDIHDNIGQTLSLAKLHLNTLKLNEHTSEEKIQTTRDLVGKAINDLRALSKTLNTETLLNGGLTQAIAYELQLMENSGVFTTRLTTIGTPREVGSQKELILFRIVQEALNNCIKHAEASKVEVQLNYQENALELSILDNGKGLSEERSTPGSGLLNMRNRASLIGATFTIRSGSEGTTIQLKLPWETI